LGARAERFFVHASAAPSLALRVRGERAALIESLAAARPDASVRASDLSPLAVVVRGAGDPRRIPGFAEGAFAVQDEGSQWIALAVGARPGERVLDACSGRGGKSLVLADAVGAGGELVAVDLSSPKLEQLGREVSRLGLSSRVETRAVDLAVGLGGLSEASFDRVLVDAPCTGLGTLGRRPEIALRLTPDDPARMARVQQAILANAARLVKPGGRLVYAVCSVAGVEAAHTPPAGFALVRDLEVGGRRHEADADGVFRIGPWTDDAPMDAYQVVVLERGVGEPT
jgi:16S rRNA (cytosine967-C5)-methyltransferase